MQVNLVISRMVIVLFVNRRCYHIRVHSAGGVVIIFTVGALGKLVCLERFGHVQLVGRKPSHWASEMLYLILH